jgi:hypothetical protein
MTTGVGDQFGLGAAPGVSFDSVLVSAFAATLSGALGVGV